MSDTNPTPGEGYLEEDYLSDEYMEGGSLHSFGMQVNQVITGATHTNGMQSQQTIKANPAYGMQARQIVGAVSAYGMQVNRVTGGSGVIGMQAEMLVNDTLKLVGMQAKESNLRHALHGVYLEGGYLEESYLAEVMCAFLGMQASAKVNEVHTLGMQANQVIKDVLAPYGMQSQQTINKTLPLGMQVNRIRTFTIGMQVTQVIYNTTQIRFMCEFPSRGTPAQLGNNWTSSSTAAGDFQPRNLNTDIIEQVFRSNSSIVTLTCDTGIPQGVPTDTVAILGHNITRSAIIQLQGSQSGTFSPPDKIINITPTLDNTIWIADELPKSDGQNRHWRFIIQDPTNPDGYIQIGAILFGASDIFTVKENFDNPIVTGYRHFKDAVPTEGFTNVMNDRALKRFLRLNFAGIQSEGGNFRIIDDMVKFARTSLKCLVIPTPQNPDRFSVFAKLTDIPEYQITAVDDDDLEADHVSFDLSWDESL